jgi:hypothetical protein
VDELSLPNSKIPIYGGIIFTSGEEELSLPNKKNYVGINITLLLLNSTIGDDKV